MILSSKLKQNSEAKSYDTVRSAICMKRRLWRFHHFPQIYYHILILRYRPGSKITVRMYVTWKKATVRVTVCLLFRAIQCFPKEDSYMTLWRAINWIILVWNGARKLTVFIFLYHRIIFKLLDVFISGEESAKSPLPKAWIFSGREKWKSPCNYYEMGSEF